MTVHDPNHGASRHGAVLRQWFWRGVWRVNGRLEVTGRRPGGPGVLVANHASHADAAALLAALPAASRPVLAAAADYWLANRWRRLAVNTVVSVIPVHRSADGAYAALLAAARPAVQEGGLVIVFPEGTRSIDGKVGEFRSGAIRLAADLGVPLTPAAIVGTDAVFPKHGGIRRGSVAVHFGSSIAAQDLPRDAAGATALADRLRRTVLALRENRVST